MAESGSALTQAGQAWRGALARHSGMTGRLRLGRPGAQAPGPPATCVKGSPWATRTDVGRHVGCISGGVLTAGVGFWASATGLFLNARSAPGLRPPGAAPRPAA